MDGPAGDTEAIQALAGTRRRCAEEEAAAYEERVAINRSLFIIQDHLAELDARLARLEPLLRAGALVRTGLSRLAKILRFPLKLAALILHWRETGQRIKDARFRSERAVFNSARSVFIRKVDFSAFARHLRRTSGLLPPTVYRIEPRQRLALARRPESCTRSRMFGSEARRRLSSICTIILGTVSK